MTMVLISITVGKKKKNKVYILTKLCAIASERMYIHQGWP